MRAVLESLTTGISRHFDGVAQYLWYSPQKYRHRKTPCEFFPDRHVHLLEDRELAYLSSAFDSVGQFMDQAERRKNTKIKILAALLEKHHNVIHIIQNPTLLKNPVETKANAILAQALSDQNYIQIWHIHDLLEDDASRHELRARIKKLAGSETERFFGFNGAGIGWHTAPNIFYAVINKKAHWAIQHFILPKQREAVFYFPDAIDAVSYQLNGSPAPADAVDALLNRFCFSHRAQGYSFDPDAELLIAAEMARERKNTGEQILLLNMLNAMRKETGRHFQLLVTMLPETGHDRRRIETFRMYIRSHRLPVVMGFGPQIVSRGNEREAGKFTLADLWNHPRAFVELSTAVKEGFGLNFICPAIASAAGPYALPTVGRRLYDVFPDFEAAGMIMPERAYYDAIPVDQSILRDNLSGFDEKSNTLRPFARGKQSASLPPGYGIKLGRDFCSYGAGEQVLLMDCIDYRKLAARMQGFVECIFDRKTMNAVAKHNAQAIRKHLSLKPYIGKLKHIVDQAFALKEKRLRAGEQADMVRDSSELAAFYSVSEKSGGSLRLPGS